MRARQWGHLCQLRGGRHGNRHLLRAFAKHGEESFEWSVLEEVEGGNAALIVREQHWIDVLSASTPASGFNIVDIARRMFPMTGRKHSDEARRKITERQLGVTRSRGEQTGQAKLCDEQIRQIRGLHEIGHSYKQLAAAFGVTKPTVQAIAEGRTWQHVTGSPASLDVNVPTKRVLRGADAGSSKLNTETVLDIRARLARGALGKTIAAEMGLSQSQVSAIKLRKAWAHLS